MGRRREDEEVVSHETVGYTEYGVTGIKVISFFGRFEYGQQGLRV